MVKISTPADAEDRTASFLYSAWAAERFWGSSIKYFPMGGLKCRDEYNAGGSRARHFLAGADRWYRSGKL
jgi:hypothetical protein